jgi:transposase
MVAYLKLLIARLRHDRFGASSERGRKLLDQMELELEELEAAASKDEAQVPAHGQDSVSKFYPSAPRARTASIPSARERMVLPSPAACPCCGGKLAKLGKSITETLEAVPRQWKVIQTVLMP